jgi:hypothetical protein
MTAAAKNQCTLWVRRLPLERFRLPSDGRKWKQAALGRSDLLIRLSTYANGDGTFIGTDGQNYSPSWKTLTQHVAEKSLDRRLDALRDLHLLLWTREHHYDRRIYQIHLSDSPESPATFDSKQVSHSRNHLSDSSESPVRLAGNDSNHLSDWTKSPVTMGGIPSLPSNDSVQPTVQPRSDGGSVGKTFVNSPRENRLVPFTPERLRRELQGAYAEARKQYEDEVGDYELGIPKALLLNGFDAVVAALRGYDNGGFYEYEDANANRSADSMDVVGGGCEGSDSCFRDWLRDRFFPSFKNGHRIEVPLTNFAHDIVGYLDDRANELHAVEAEFATQSAAQPSAAKTARGK